VEKSFILETVFGLVVAAIAELSSLALLLRPRWSCCRWRASPHWSSSSARAGCFRRGFARGAPEPPSAPPTWRLPNRGAEA